MIRRYIVPLFKSIYSLLLIFAAVLSACVWYFAPLIGGETWRPFDTEKARIITIVLIWIFFLLLIGFIFWRRRRKDREMTDEIAESVDTSEDDMLAEEIGELRGKFKLAMVELRKSKNGRRHLNDLPWYVMIGPPGAGKTTAIVNSGLQFPLAEKLGKAAIGGVGGTRNCDWWFTNDAVLIDTAGRYTTQESDAEADNAAWIGFLGLLKKYRKRQPINGAIVAISLSDLSLQDEITQKGHAQAVRRRLSELREKLGVRFPVYVLFTKADLIAGFSEFHDILGKEDREQVWGFTLPLPKGKKDEPPIARFDEEFALLLGQLNAQLLEKMQVETDHQRRALVAGFPAQVASVRTVARDFLNEVFQDNRYDQRQMLRGIYFASGTQEGTPIDRLMLGMAQTFGIGRQAIGTGQGTGRSFFLTRLFEGVMFPEAGLVSADDKVERRYRWTRRIAITATILVALATGSLWVNSFLKNSDLIEEAEKQVEAYQAAAATLPPSPIGDTDLVPVAAALNLLRDLPANPVLSDPKPERELTYGLYQGEVVGTQAAQTYRAALNQRLLPRLLVRLEEQITGNINNPDLLYEALKIYLMLGLQGPMNQDLVKEWMRLDWELVAYPGIARAQLRNDLMDHMTALLTQPMEEVALNGPLIAQVQGLLSELPLAQRVYNGIINSNTATSLPKWRLTEVGGPSVKRVLVRSSGKPLNEGIEGIFTYDGFHDVFLPEAVSVAERVQREAWVLGQRSEEEQSNAALLALSRDVLDLYYNDYITRYDTLLGDVDIIPLESLSHAVEVTNVLSGPTSPITNILTEVSKETSLATERAALDTSALSGGASQVAAIEARSNLSIQGQILLEALVKSTGDSGGVPPKPPGSYVQERFQWLHNLVQRPEGQPSQLDDLMVTLQLVYQELNKMSFSGVATGGEALLQFQQSASRVDGPVQRWASQISTGSSGITSEGTRASINARWQASVLPFCTQALDNRYPFNRRARADVAMADFAKLFSPGGLIDGFFNENLAKYVDTRTRPWTWKRVNDVDLGISPAVLVQMQYAAEIRDAFFATGPTPAVQFQITPKALDPKAKEVLLEIDGSKVAYGHRSGSPTPVAVTWPGAVGLARITLSPKKRDNENTMSRDGPWAWFRLLDAAEVRRTNVSDRRRVNFRVGGRLALFELQSGSVINPFALPAMAKFNCPKSM
ncbi:type VI secretion system membrane subunit TssM [Parasedimentitalea huanghaiensis]|uniref:Type VI secretion system membrane subunit TssM n=1 Tax=Parasedimentitalea huanghaiensis TaxID=2682100 RepID=A0A6L6WMG0_9RHOB|nr:type VI secretion system membrane subunit TssM [Zongyanglinia huanghaiensis]MVO18681.1 type VI secretion system membrane subunit TssM [Zongyanglinia huanghaiensis]